MRCAGMLGLVLTCLACLGTRADQGAPCPAEEPPRQGEVLARFPIAGDGDLLIVPVTIKGKSYPFVVDTGATEVLYDSSLRPLLGPQVDRCEALGAEAVVQVDRFEPPEAFLGTLPLPRNRPAPIYDMSRFRKLCGQDIRGLVGMAFLRQYIVCIDFDKGVLTLRKSLPAPKGEALPLYFAQDSDLPTVDADVCGCGPPERFVVDTGCVGEGAGDIEASLFEALTRLGRMDRTGRCLSASLGHHGYHDRGRLLRLGFGPFVNQRLVLSSSRSSKLGIAFWSRFQVTFDFPHKRVYLRKGTNFDRPETINRSGLHLSRPAAATVVSAVDVDGPAARAGIKRGDVLLSVGELQAERTRLHPLRLRFCAAGETVAVTLKRGDKAIRVSLRLEADKGEPTVQANNKP